MEGDEFHDCEGSVEVRRGQRERRQTEFYGNVVPVDVAIDVGSSGLDDQGGV